MLRAKGTGVRRLDTALKAAPAEQQPVTSCRSVTICPAREGHTRLHSARWPGRSLRPDNDRAFNSSAGSSRAHSR